MQFYLVHRFGQEDGLQYSNQPFSTEHEATMRPCSLIGAGEVGDFLIADEGGRIDANDAEIKGRCRTTLD